MESFGWRIVFAVGGLVALGGLALRRTLPETDRASEVERGRRQPFSEIWRNYRAAIVRILIIGSAGLVVMYGLTSLLPSLGPTFTSITREQAAHVNTIGSAAMLVASPFLGLMSDRIGRLWTVRLFAVAGIFAIPVMASLDGTVGHQFVAQLFAVLLMCTWAAGAFAAFPEMLPLAMRATGIAAPYGLAAAIVGGFSPMISTSVASNRGLVGVGCLIAAMTLTAGAATIGMKETAYRSLRER